MNVKADDDGGELATVAAGIANPAGVAPGGPMRPIVETLPCGSGADPERCPACRSGGPCPG